MLIFAAFALAIIIFPFIYKQTSRHSPFVPISRSEIKRLLKTITLKPGQTIIDLGSGDGRVLLAAAKLNLKIKAIGFEDDFALAIWSKLKVSLSRSSRQIQIKRQDFFRADLSQADIIFLYLLPKTLAKLEPKLQSELSSKGRSGFDGKPGAVIISYRFPLLNRKPNRVVEPKLKKEKSIYIYYPQ